MQKKLLVKSLIVLFVILSINSQGENLVKNGNAGNGTENWTNVELVSSNSHSGKNCFTMTAQSIATSKELIPVDNTEQYKISGWFKSEGVPVQRLLLGLVPYDKNKTQIYCWNVI